jgi:3-dehydroquinate synthase
MHSLANFIQLEVNFNDYEFFIIDSNVYRLYTDHLDFLIDKKVFVVDDPELSKSLEAFEKLTSFFLDQGIKRSSTLVVIGGGATSDLGGFVASTILRGISWIVVPTTLLSMIDASIGGKVGLNTKQGKNLIGAFHNPTKNYINLEFLKTQKKVDYESGLGEMVKYFFIDSKLNSSDSIDNLILKCASLKESIITEDFKEKGLREVLNYGHTFGHGIEKMSSLTHGMSVLTGIYLNISIFTPSLMPFLKDILKVFNLTIPNLALDKNDFLKCMSFDKKNIKDGEIRFIIFKNRGDYQNIGLETKLLKEKLSNFVGHENFFS